MSTKSKETSRILDAVHETARDLHATGFVSKRRMKEYDALCLVREQVPARKSRTSLKVRIR
jgi:hypothetical protein